MSGNQQLGAVPTLKYLDLKAFGPFIGRGGAVRNFFLRRGIPFNEELTSFPEWHGGVKQQMIDSRESPAGGLPVVSLNGKTYDQHHSILRMLGRRLNEYGLDAEVDFQIDRAADATGTFRDQLVISLLQKDTKEAYLQSRPEFYRALNTLLDLTNAEGSTVVGTKQSFADDLWYGVVSDDVLMYGSEELEKNDKIKAFYDAYGSLEPIHQWKTVTWQQTA